MLRNYCSPLSDVRRNGQLQASNHKPALYKWTVSQNVKIIKEKWLALPTNINLCGSITTSTMHTIYHLNSAQEANSDIIDSIKAAFKSKPITIIVQVDDENEYDFTIQMKDTLNNRLMEDESEYLSGEESLKKLNDKYGL